MESAGKKKPAICLNVRFVSSIDWSDKKLVGQIAQLANEAFGQEEDTMQQLKKGGGRVAVLLAGTDVVSYANYVIRSTSSSMNVNKLAVTQVHRRCGLGR